MTPKIDFDTMHANCIQIHQECYEIELVTKQRGLPLLTISKDELKSNEKTKSWDGMGRYAKELYDNKEIWETLPPQAQIVCNEMVPKLWKREEARASLLDCFEQLGGKNLYF